MFYVAGRIKWGTWGISLPPSLLVSGASLFAMAGFLSQCWVSYAVDFLFFFARDCIFIYMQFWDHLPFTDVLLILDRQTRATLFQNYFWVVWCWFGKGWIFITSKGSQFYPATYLSSCTSDCIKSCLFLLVIQVILLSMYMLLFCTMWPTVEK